MKKSIKILLLAIFMVLFLGITTSNAAIVTVTETTTAKDMLTELNKGNQLTGITDDIRDNSDKIKDESGNIMENIGYLLCSDLNCWLNSSANYDLANTKVMTYPKDDSEKGYAKAYILAAPGYVKSDDKSGKPTKDDERQWAWYCINGQNDDYNDLYDIAIAYQQYKENEIKFELIGEKTAKTFSSGDKIGFGPIQIKYSYASIKSGDHSDEWGGFNYAFFDEEGNNISNKVSLAILENGEYKTITSSKKDDGYYKVTTNAYNGESLYIVTTDKTISKINIKIQKNDVEYTASVYELQGEYYNEKNGVGLCASCLYKIKTLAEVIQNPTEDIVYFDETNGKAYEFINTNSNVKGPNYYYTTYSSGVYHWANLGGSRLVSSGIPAGGGNAVGLIYLTRLGTYVSDQETAAKTYFYSSNGGYQCYRCSGDKGWKQTYNEMLSHARSHAMSMQGYRWTTMTFMLTETSEVPCKKTYSGGKGNWQCGFPKTEGWHESQKLLLVEDTKNETIVEADIEIPIELTTSIEITKEWNDSNNAYKLRPESLKFNVFRTTDQLEWTKLNENTDYKVSITNIDGDTWKIVISGLARRDSNGKEYSFKVEEQELNYYQAVYPEGYTPKYNESTSSWNMKLQNSLKKINLSGYVWLDEQTGVKPAVAPNGIMDASEKKLEGITVYLYYKDPSTGKTNKVATAVTDKNGYYEFKNYEIGYYYVVFEYDGINYKNTIKVDGGSSKAFETEALRNTFNSRFQTITYGKSNDGTALKYSYSNNKSTLITTDGNKVKSEFIMNAETAEALYSKNTTNINLGLVKRETDIALSTDVADAEVSINGQKTTYTYSKADNTMEISNGQTSEKVSYNLNLYTSDYNYRIRDYISNSEFKENGYVNDGNPEGTKTGEELKVYVKYALNLQNQSVETVRINEAKYVFDEKYSFKGITDGSYTTSVSGNIITIDLKGLELKYGETKTIYLLFEVNNNNGLNLGNFTNKAEITSYSTDEGLIDTDSQPGNFINDNQVEDDSDTAGGLTIKVEDTFVRKITGKVFDEDNKNVNDVIVQLIELKTVNGKVYEYIWQETVSGTGKGKKISADGTKLEEYTYTKADGKYEFAGVIPGDYIVRFIYGDGTTYDMTENVIKYNGQDYKSVKDANYNAEWYNSSTYTAGASVARDNEARRLETMAYSVNIDAEKGLLLKLLDNVTLNETEKETLVAVYNKLYDPDITEVTTEVINKLLKEQTLKNTWMCAETSKIKVAVDTENVANTNTATTVNGVTKTYVNEISNINLGLEIRPVTKIELKKYITGFKLVASNGQTLVNAYIDVNEYLANPTDISNKVQGIKDNVTILDTVWQYELAPTDINTVVDGASLEFEYTLVVRNTGETDYLSKELTDAYANNNIEEYAKILANKATEMKGYMRSGTYKAQIGKNLGNSYYTGGTGNTKVLTEITNIRDYINNDLTFITSSGDVAVDEDAPHTYRILRDDYSIQQATINTVLTTTKTTGKLSNDGNAVMYKITLGKNPISSTGNLNFENYIAEVMSFTNAAGRRSMTSTPGNAEIIDHEHRTGRTHEIDEADTARIQIGVSTGEDEKTNYIIAIAVAGALTLMAVGTVLVKKYVIK